MALGIRPDSSIPLDLVELRHPLYLNASGRTSLTSTITSPGTLARRAASRIASALGASYKQYDFLQSALRKENSHCTPTSALMSSISEARSRVISICSAKCRSITNSGIHVSSYARDDTHCGNAWEENTSASCIGYNQLAPADR